MHNFTEAERRRLIGDFGIRRASPSRKYVRAEIEMPASSVANISAPFALRYRALVALHMLACVTYYVGIGGREIVSCGDNAK